MKRFVVDASVAIKWFLGEIHSEAATRLVDSSVQLSAPDLIGPEFGNILWKKIRRNEITRSDASRILAGFQAIDIEVYPSADLLPFALEIAAELDRTVYDSLYLALAIAQDCQLVSADQKFVSAVAASALSHRVRWIEEES
jgi:predicted nucleic acid-binding protein